MNTSAATTIVRRSRPDNPTIGYYGAIAEWFDSELVAKLAALRPGWRFELIGSTLAGNVRRAGGPSQCPPAGRMPLCRAARPHRRLGCLHHPVPPPAADRGHQSREGLRDARDGQAGGGRRAARAGADRPERADPPGGDGGEDSPRRSRRMIRGSMPDRGRRRAFARRNTWAARHRKLAEAIEDVRCPPSTTLSAPQPWGTAAPACRRRAAR